MVWFRYSAGFTLYFSKKRRIYWSEALPLGAAMTFPSSQRANASLSLKSGASLRTKMSEQRVPSDMSVVDTILTLPLARTHSTVVMVTHDVDEAVLLSDRIVMMTNGPAATIGEILSVDLPRPRNRLALANDPKYIAARAAVLEFLYEKQAHKEVLAA